jgi:hypothetical protein
LTSDLAAYVPTSRTLTINGTTQDLTADRTFTISTGITIGTTPITSGTDGRILFQNGGVVSQSANLFFDVANGRLGIGGTPSSQLTIAKTGSNNYFNFEPSATGTAPYLQALYQGVVDARIYFDSNSFKFRYAGSTLAYAIDCANITSNGNIVLTGSTEQKLHLFGSTNNYIQYTDAGAVNIGVIGTADATTYIQVRTGSATNMSNGTLSTTFFNSGNVGIGGITTDAGFKLDVNGTARVVGQGTIQTLTIGLGAAAVANNTALGFQALNANTTGSGNTAAGYQSMLANTTGVNNAAFGISAMSGSTTGSDNSAFGYYALAGANTGASNTAIGNRSLIVNTSGSYNTAVGRSALNSNTTGLNNVAIGYLSLRLNVIGQDNVAIGSNALSASTGDVNTAVGSGAMSANTTGQFNTAIGTSALSANTTGSGNTAVGFSTQTGNFSNSVILGWGATATASNQFVIGTAARNAGAVTTEVNASTQVWNVIINGVARKILLA